MNASTAAAILTRMTRREKLAQVRAVSIVDLVDKQSGCLLPERLQQHLKDGIGQVTRPAGWSDLPPERAAGLCTDLQRFLTRETRLGIPAVLHEECLSGLSARGTTVFPQAISMASTWDPALVERVAEVIRREMLAIGARQGLGPVLDLVRDPRWGRCEETFGEDPHLVAELGLAYVRGLQGPDLSAGVGATVKHFVGHGVPEGGRNEAPVRIGPREVRDVHMRPFERAVREGRVLAVMNAYHDLDGVPCAASRSLLTEVLREEWGFDGVVVSDYEAVDQLRRMHFVAQDKSEAAALALEAGIDTELPNVDCFGDPLAAALDAGRLDEAVLDRAVLRVLEAKQRLGLLGASFDAVPDVSCVNDPAARALALEAARRCPVLLKNAGALPLASSLRSIAVIGPNADVARNQLGDYAYESLMGVPDPSTPGISVLEGLRERLGGGVRIVHAAGCDVGGASTDGFAAAVEAARAAEVALVVAGGRSGSVPVLRGYAQHGDTSGEGRDRAEIGLPGVQEALVRAVAATGTPVVLVVIDGRPLALGGVADLATAILYAWLPGKPGGRAIAEILCGDVEPSGRLPVSLPRETGQVPVHYSRHPSSSKWHYIFGPNTPLFPFGHGLTYTRFEYRNLELSAAEVDREGTVVARVTLENGGARPGVEVVQLYVRDEHASVVRPVRELRAFTRVALQAGERTVVELAVRVPDLGFHDLAMRRRVEPGRFEVQVGASAEDIRLRDAFVVRGE